MSCNPQESSSLPEATRCASGHRSCQQCRVWRELIDDSNIQRQSELDNIAQHCQGCETMLAHSSNAQFDWWQEAQQAWLEGELPNIDSSGCTTVSVELQPLAVDSEQAIDIEPVSLDFLTPAVHPELLGRLGRYDIERVIGVGGMGVVLRAFDGELHRVVAIKVLNENLSSNSSARRRFAREAQAIAAVVHPNVIPIFNVDSNERLPYLVMQYVSGGSLQSKVDCTGPMSVAEALRIARQTAAGLAAAHEQGLVHRDIKPANILLEQNVDRALLSDFGLARAADDASLTRTGVVAGTPHYMSPEQANGDSLNFSSDLFSLGSVIYFMLTGHPPFRAQSAMGVLNRICHSPHRPLCEACQQVPLEVSQFVDRLLEKQPQLRPESTAIVLQHIDQLLSALQSGKLRLSMGGQSEKNRSVVGKTVTTLQPLRWWLASLAVVVLACGASWWASSWFHGSTEQIVESHAPVSGNSITVKQLDAVRSEYNDWLAQDQAWSQSVAEVKVQADRIEQSSRNTNSQSLDANAEHLQRIEWQLQQLRNENEVRTENP